MGHGPGPEHAGEVVLQPYRGFGTPRRLSLCGRVLKNERFAPGAANDPRWRNLRAFFRRLESDEVSGAKVLARYAGMERTVVSDREGYFSVEFELDHPVPADSWHAIDLHLAENPQIKATGEVLVPGAADTGVISDIDDTIIVSEVTRKLRMLMTAALSNAYTRKPFPGVGAFYRALAEGGRPFFYVSKSPWNLYAPIQEFMALHGLPPGPLLLRDWGLKPNKRHKEESIERILSTYPERRFVLVGDSGEQDPEIYAAVVARHPERIRVIYVRSVDPDDKRVAAVAALAAELAKTGCQLVLGPDTEYAAAHAAAEGLIAPGSLAAIRQEARAEQPAPRTPPRRAAH